LIGQPLRQWLTLLKVRQLGAVDTVAIISSLLELQVSIRHDSVAVTNFTIAGKYPFRRMLHKKFYLFQRTREIILHCGCESQAGEKLRIIP
jgi:hypothetical protein